MQNLPTLKELVAQQNVNEQNTTPFPMILNLLLHDYDSSVEPPNTKATRTNAIESDQTRNNARGDSQHRSSEIIAVLRERDDKANDVFNEETLDDENIARIQRDDAGTTTPKATTMRGTPLASSTTTRSANRGFYVTKALIETTYAPIETTDFVADITERPAHTVMSNLEEMEQPEDETTDDNDTKVVESVTEATIHETVAKSSTETVAPQTSETNGLVQIKNAENITSIIQTSEDEAAIESTTIINNFNPLDKVSATDSSVTLETTLPPTTTEVIPEEKATSILIKDIDNKSVETTTPNPTTVEFSVTTFRTTSADLQGRRPVVRKRGKQRFRNSTIFVSPNQEQFRRKSSRRITSDSRNAKRNNRGETRKVIEQQDKVGENDEPNESSTRAQHTRRRLTESRSRQQSQKKVTEEPRKIVSEATAVNNTNGGIVKESRSVSKNSRKNGSGGARETLKELVSVGAANEYNDETIAATIISDTTTPAGATTTATLKKFRKFFLKRRIEDTEVADETEKYTEVEMTTGVADETIGTTVDSANEPVHETSLPKSTRVPRPGTRRPGTLSRNDLINRLRDRTNPPTTLPPFFSDLQSTAALLTNIRKIKPTESTPTTLPGRTENLVINVVSTESPTTAERADNRVPDANDQAIRAQELALSLVDAPLSQSTSGQQPAGNGSRRRISTTIAPRPNPSAIPTSTTSLARQSSVIRNRQKAKPAQRVPDYVTSRPRRPPVIDYDYYEDGEESIIGKSTLNSKLFLTTTGTIRCLDQGNFPHPSSCKKFITCARMVNGLVIGAEYTCPDKLSFDPVGGICNWSAGLGCKE